MSKFTFSSATPNDIDAIRALLVEAKLPSEEFAPHLDHFLTAKENGTLAGAVGLEIYEQAGLLRSLVVNEAYRGQGVGIKLCEQMFTYAHNQGVENLYLLTTTAAEFFPKLGFSTTNRDGVPPTIQSTEEFSSICPSTAVCMIKAL